MDASDIRMGGRRVKSRKETDSLPRTLSLSPELEHGLADQTITEKFGLLDPALPD